MLFWVHLLYSPAKAEFCTRPFPWYYGKLQVCKHRGRGGHCSFFPSCSGTPAILCLRMERSRWTQVSLTKYLSSSDSFLLLSDLSPLLTHHPTPVQFTVQTYPDLSNSSIVYLYRRKLEKQICKCMNCTYVCACIHLSMQIPTVNLIVGIGRLEGANVILGVKHSSCLKRAIILPEKVPT